jgi:ABC-2 type transport system permease protein
MTTTLQTAAPGRYGLRQVAKSEVVKILTLRSTLITLGLTVVASLLVTGLVTNAALHQRPEYYVGFDPTQNSLTGMITVALTGGVFGALLITGEYASGTIRTTLAATPRRPLLLATKMGVTALLTLVFCELLSLVSFLLGEAVLSSGGAPSASLGSPGAARAVLMTGAFIALLALMSFGFGLIFRSTAAAIAAFVGVVFVLPLVVHGISEHAMRFLPTNILTNSIMSTVNQAPPGAPNQPLTPAVGLLLMALYAAIALAVGAVLFVRRDA